MTDGIEAFERATQLTLLPRARHNDPQTSKAAAARVATIAVSLESQICDVLNRYGRLTKDGVCQMLGVHPRRWPSVASALSRLKNDGTLCWTGEIVDHQNVWALSVENVRTDVL